MRLSDVDPKFREALSTLSLFMGFGLPADDVYSAYAKPLLRVVARQRGREFVVDVADIGEMSEDEFAGHWVDAAKAWNDAPHAERDEMVLRSEIRGKAVALMWAMQQKGFVLGKNAMEHKI